MSNKIALYDIDETDINVLSQILANHPDRIVHEEVESLNDITSDTYDLCLTTRDIKDSPVPTLLLYPDRRRIGELVDRIESILLQNRYGDLCFNGYDLNWRQSTLSYNVKSVELTERERYLIAEIMGGGDQGRSRDYLLNKIWGYRSDLETHTLETHIYRLRQKIEDEPDHPKRLITVDGGYKLT